MNKFYAAAFATLITFSGVALAAQAGNTISRVWCQKCSTARTCITMPIIGEYCFESTTCTDIPCPDHQQEK